MGHSTPKRPKLAQFNVLRKVCHHQADCWIVARSLIDLTVNALEPSTKLNLTDRRRQALPVHEGIHLGWWLTRYRRHQVRKPGYFPAAQVAIKLFPPAPNLVASSGPRLRLNFKQDVPRRCHRRTARRAKQRTTDALTSDRPIDRHVLQ